jgi:hypothetical protein
MKAFGIVPRFVGKRVSSKKAFFVAWSVKRGAGSVGRERISYCVFGGKKEFLRKRAG